MSKCGGQNGDRVWWRGIRSEHPTNQRESERICTKVAKEQYTIRDDQRKRVFGYKVKEENKFVVFPVSKSKWNMTRKYGGGDGNEGNRDEGRWKDLFLNRKKEIRNFFEGLLWPGAFSVARCKIERETSTNIVKKDDDEKWLVCSETKRGMAEDFGEIKISNWQWKRWLWENL